MVQKELLASLEIYLSKTLSLENRVNFNQKNIAVALVYNVQWLGNPSAAMVEEPRQSETARFRNIGLLLPTTNFNHTRSAKTWQISNPGVLFPTGRACLGSARKINMAKRCATFSLPRIPYPRQPGLRQMPRSIA